MIKVKGELSVFQHFLDYITKDYVEDISMIPLEYLQEADVRLVVIGPAPYKFIQVRYSSSLGNFSTKNI